MADQGRAELEPNGGAVNRRPTCCWTRCNNEQGTGTWMDINGETLPVCEEHWYGNLDAERRRLRDENERLRAALHRAYVLIKDERDGWNERRHDEITQAVEDICPLLNLPTFDDVKGILG